MAFGLKYDSIENYLNSYGKYIVRQAKNLLKFNTATGRLQGSLKHKVEETKDGYELKFLASKYSSFVLNSLFSPLYVAGILTFFLVSF